MYYEHNNHKYDGTDGGDDDDNDDIRSLNVQHMNSQLLVAKDCN